jgi:hypothetical protein
MSHIFPEFVLLEINALVEAFARDWLEGLD